MYQKVLKALEETIAKAQSFDGDKVEIDDLQKTLRHLKMSLDDGLVKFNDNGQWSMEKAVTPKAGVYHLSNKWSGKIIPESHPDRKVMVAHINSMNQAGNHSEARRVYDQHISGGGAYSAGTTEKTDRSDFIKPSTTSTIEDKVAQAKWDHGTKVDDVAGKNMKLEEQRFKRAKVKVKV